jgi:hypothetical protein
LVIDGSSFAPPEIDGHADALTDQGAPFSAVAMELA